VPDVSAYERVLEAVGSAVVSGETRPGAVDTVNAIEYRTGASRSVVREAVRVLVGLGLLRAGRRVGLTVRPPEDWNVLDPLVIRWRLQADRSRQLAELVELRLAVEPEAARQAALRRTPDQAAELMAVASELASTPASPDSFGAADRLFHDLLLESSGNLLFARLGLVIGEVVQGRAAEQSASGPDRRDMELHLAVAAAVDSQDGRGAAAAMRQIIELTASA
jgi:DNA-binding FadR family transcriptional regulator